MKKIIPFSCALLCTGSFVVYLLYSLGGRPLVESFSLNQWGGLLLIVLTSSLVIWLGYHYLIRQFKWRKRVSLRFGLNLILLWGSAMLAVYLLSLRLEDWSEGSEAFSPDNRLAFLLKGAIVGFLMSLLIIWGDFSWFAYNRYSSETLTQLQTNRKQKELQYQLLRSQLTPHFLFNSLNTASNLTSTAPAQAEIFLRKLAANFIYLLEHSKAPLNSLEKELEIVDNFFHLMQVRFGQKIMLEKNIEPACLSRKLPTLSLQLLVENALKHNVATAENPVLISIKAVKKGVVVVNNATSSPAQVVSRGVGLKNLQARYQHFSNRQLLASRSDSHYQVQLPYIREPKLKANV